MRDSIAHGPAAMLMQESGRHSPVRTTLPIVYALFLSWVEWTFSIAMHWHHPDCSRVHNRVLFLCITPRFHSAQLWHFLCWPLTSAAAIADHAEGDHERTMRP